MEVIMSMIATVGFPIAACLLLGWFIWNIYKQSEKREADLRKEIKENQEINKEAIKTLALYAERLGVIETNMGAIQTDVTEIKEDIMILTERVS